jgi:hypothetical protein
MKFLKGFIEGTFDALLIGLKLILIAAVVLSVIVWLFKGCLG